MAHILVVDDDQDILRLLDFILKRAGHEVSAARDGVEGLAIAMERPPDLIVADIMMPKMNGYEFCRQIRAASQTAQVPIIVFSARFQPVDKQTALEAGATDYLPKSTSPEDLLKRIEELLAESTPGGTRNRAIGFFSMRGGAGVTSLAVNTAIALALVKKTQVALVDLSPLGGHTALMLGLRPSRTLADALNSPRLLTPDSLAEHILPHPTGVHLLASPPSFEAQFSPQHRHLPRLARVLKSSYQFCLFDMSHQTFDEQIASIWHQLDRVVLVLSPDLPSMQSTAMALQGLAWVGVPAEKIWLVVNQITPHYQLPSETIQKSVRREIVATIPFEPAMVKAVNSGKPLMMSGGRSAGATAIARLAARLVG